MTALSIRSDSESDASLSARFTTRDVLVGGWMIATIIAYYHNFLFLQSTELTYVYAFVSYGIGVVYAYVDSLVRKLVAIGTIGGILELLGDHFLVHMADSLVYPYQYSPVLSSPVYMPFAWAVLIVFMGYVAVRLREEVRVVAAYLGPAMFAFVSESGYESLASQGGGWSYVSAHLGGSDTHPCSSWSRRQSCSCRVITG